jgi:hypothetical protein
MTIFLLILCLVFGFLAFRHFRNGRFIWGVIAAFGSLLMFGSVLVDYLRATDQLTKSTPPVQAEPGNAAPEIRDYDPTAASQAPAS